MRARDHRCAVCGRPATNLHHRLPRSRGGPDDDFNRIPVCGSGTHGCHGRIEHNPEWARSKRLSIPGYMLRGIYYGPDIDYLTRYR